MTTIDRFPNFLSGEIIEAGAVTFTTTRVNTPIPRIGTGRRGKSTVMELLFMDVTLLGETLDAGGEAVNFEMSIGTPPAAFLSWDDPRVFCSKIINMHILTTGGGSLEQPFRYNFQDANGFGYLLASDAFNVSIVGTGAAAAFTAGWKLFYRFVDITAEEFIGIVQSQST